jgi:hypothetical protein
MSAQASTSSGTAYQNASTFLFVPQAFGRRGTAADDTNAPGAYFRLGGFSDIESRAAAKDAFYPRQHITDATSANAVTQAAGADAAQRGIMLACSGRLLIRAAEKTYLHSTGDIHIDTQGTLKVKAEGLISVSSLETITIKSGTEKDLVISAGGGTGTVTTKSLKSVKQVNGEEYEYITKDSFKYYQCDIYTYKLGGIVDINMGGRFAFWTGSQLSITMSIDVTISMATTFAFWYFKFDLGVVKMDFYKTKLEFKDGKFSVAAWKGGNYLAATGSALVKTAGHGVKSVNDGIKSVASSVKSGVEGLQVLSGGMNSNMFGMVNFF